MRFSQLLEVHNLSKNFGGLAAVSELDFTVSEGEILGLIGPNGSGKSTVLNMIGGTFFPTRGRILFQGEDITRLSPHQRAKRGIARVFQRDILFHSFTALENIILSFHLHSKKGVADIFIRTAANRRLESQERDKAMAILEFVGIANRAEEKALNLSHGNQRALCLGVALATEPGMLLLDEPLTGMNAEEIDSMMSLIRRLRDEKGSTSIVVEHNMRAVVGLCDRAIVLDYGKKICEGTPKEVVENPSVIEAYLGADENAV